MCICVLGGGGTVDFSCLNIPFCVYCFGKCGVVHCSLWAVQTINFHIRNTGDVQTHLKSTVLAFTVNQEFSLSCNFGCYSNNEFVNMYTWLVSLQAHQYSPMDHIHNYFSSVFFLKVAGDYNFNAVAFKFEICT